jgi:hypothetical protein
MAVGTVGGALKLGVLRKQGVDWTASVLADVQEQAQYVEALEARVSLEEVFKEAEASKPPELVKKK